MRKFKMQQILSGFTGIVESFYVKEELGLSAAFLASLGFWAGLPWALKIPLDHLVDLFWHRKSLFVYFGAMLMAASLLIVLLPYFSKFKVSYCLLVETTR